MNGLVNKVQLIGNLGADPEVKELESGRKVANMRLATNEHFRRGDGEKITETNWHRIVAWGNIAGIAEKYLKKGSEIAIEGRLVTRDYDDKDGNKHYITEVVVNEILMLDKKEK